MTQQLVAAPLDFGARRACVCVRIGGKTISRQAPDDCELSAVQELGSVQKSPGKNSAIKHRLEEVRAVQMRTRQIRPAQGRAPEELSPNLGDGLRHQAAAVWDCEDAGLAATSIPSVNLTP